MERSRSILRATIGFVSAAVAIASHAATITIDTVAGTVTGDPDGNPAQFNGRPFTFTPAVGTIGLARLYVSGNLTITSTDVIVATGPHAVSIVVGGNLTVQAGAQIKVSANWDATFRPGPGEPGFAPPGAGK